MALKICVATGATLDWIYRGESDCLPLKLEKARSLIFAVEVARAEAELKRR